MADQKITALTELAAAPDDSDVLVIVDDPAGSPATKKITASNLNKEQSIIVTSLASDTTPNPARASRKTMYELTALAGNALFSAPSGTPVNGDMLFISVTDNGTARALTYNAIYDDPYTPDNPTTTVANKTLMMMYMYSSTRSKWELLWTDEES